MRPIFILALLALLLSVLTSCSYEKNYYGHGEHRSGSYHAERGGDYRGYRDSHHRYRDCD